MDILEYADALNLEIELRRYPNQNGRWTARFSKSETKDNIDDCCLTGTYGNGVHPDNALWNYAKEISGKILVINAMDKERRMEYKVPDEFTMPQR